RCAASSTWTRPSSSRSGSTSRRPSRRVATRAGSNGWSRRAVSAMKRKALVAVLALAAVGAALPFVRDHERLTLDDAARAAAPGPLIQLAQGRVHYALAGP